jgi:hypothetical protein
LGGLEFAADGEDVDLAAHLPNLGVEPRFHENVQLVGVNVGALRARLAGGVFAEVRDDVRAVRALAPKPS